MNTQIQPTKSGKNAAEQQQKQEQSIQMQQMGSLSMSYPAFTDRLELSDECPQIVIGNPLLSNRTLQEAKQQGSQQQCIEVTQVQLDNNNSYPFPFAIGQTNPVDIDNSNPIIQGIPVLANPLGQLDQEHNKNYKNNNYQDSLRLQKFELERKIKPAVDSFSRYSKIAFVVMIAAIISLTTQFIISATQDNKNKQTQTVAVGGGGSYITNKDNNNITRNLLQIYNNGRITAMNTNNSSSSSTLIQTTTYASSSSSSTSPTDKMIDCVYYLSVEIVMWSGSCVTALRSLSKFSARGMSISIGMVLFSIIPQVLGYVSLASKNNDEGEIFLMILNVFIGFLELLYKLINGILQAKIVKTHFQQHARQFQGAQMLLMQQQGPTQFRPK